MVQDTTPSTPIAIASVKKAKSKSKPKSLGPLSVNEVGFALNSAVDALHALRYPFCLFGSAGCSMYGMDHRTPHDIDIVVLTSVHSSEEIKARIAQWDRRFILIPAHNPKNNWKVMWFRLQGRRRCKVDILTPGTLNIPDIPPFALFNVHGVPLMPFLCLLLLKLQGYFDHIASTEKRMHDKIPEDIEDVKHMARLGAELHRVHVMHLGFGWYESSFRQLAAERVLEFSKSFPASNPHWRAMGFLVAEEPIMLPRALVAQSTPTTITPFVSVPA